MRVALPQASPRTAAFSFAVIVFTGLWIALTPKPVVRDEPVSWRCDDNIAGKCFPGIDEPVDVVYTWVNGSDPLLQQQLQEYSKTEDPGEAVKNMTHKDAATDASSSSSSSQRRSHRRTRKRTDPKWMQREGKLDALSRRRSRYSYGGRDATSTIPQGENSPLFILPEHTTDLSSEEKLALKASGNTANRFRDMDELQYSLRSIHRNAGWVRYIYIVTNGQVPAWLKQDHPRVRIVTHAEIFANPAHLPTFSSPAIESAIHRIPGIADRVLYFNDDVMLGREVTLDDFYTESGGQKIFPAWAAPMCSRSCPTTRLGDGVCDSGCNNTACRYDWGDCIGSNVTRRSGWSGHGARSFRPLVCAPGCPISYVADGFCDKRCNVSSCAYDFGDCGAALVDRIGEGGPVAVIAVPHVKDAKYHHKAGASTAIVSEELQRVAIFADPEFHVSRAVVPVVAHTSTGIVRVNVTLCASCNVTERTASAPQRTAVGAAAKAPAVTADDNEDDNDDEEQFADAVDMLREETTGRQLLWQRAERARVSEDDFPMEGFKGSLVTANRLLTREFGDRRRFVIAHMPHFLQIPIVKRMVSHWEPHFLRTESHRFRNPTDMQYAFSYMYYLMEEKVKDPIARIFTHFDRDDNGRWSDREVLLASVALGDSVYDIGKQKPSTASFSSFSAGSYTHAIVDPQDYDEDRLSRARKLKDILQRCNTRKEDGITKRTLRRCKPAVDAFSRVIPLHRNRFTLTSREEREEIAFMMIGPKSPKLRADLDRLLERRPRFICLNDDVTGRDSQRIQRVIRDFYQTLFPAPSPFELPRGTRNKELHVHRTSWLSVVLWFVVVSSACGVGYRAWVVWKWKNAAQLRP